MKRALSLFALCAVLFAATPTFAADKVITLTLDGRPVDRAGGIAVVRNGIVYADAIDLIKSFDGLLNLQQDGGAALTIRANTGYFKPGSTSATINKVRVTLPGAPFMRNGDLYVPLAAFITKIAGARVKVTPGHADILVNANPLS